MARSSRQTSAASVDAPQVDPQPQEQSTVERETTPSETATAAVPMSKQGEAGVDYAVPGADPSNVEKKKVKTAGKFTLLDPWTGTSIDRNGAEVVVTAFIRARLANGDLVEA